MKHGTHSSYVAGCRCDACREGHRTAAREAGWNLRVGARGESKRRWDDENRSYCECGNRCSRRFARCVDCLNRERREARDLRRNDIAALWNDGCSLREIAAALKSTRNTIGREIHRMRADGWDVPYRYAMRDGKRVAA